MEKLHNFIPLLFIVLLSFSCQNGKDKDSNTNGLYESGMAKFEKGDYLEAAVDFDNAIKTNPKFGMSHYMKGRVYETIDIIDKALFEYNLAIELGGLNAEALLKVGGFYAKIENYSASIGALTKAIEIEPNQKLAYQLRAACKYNLKDYRGCMVDYDKTIELEPNNSEAYLYRGW